MLHLIHFFINLMFLLCQSKSFWIIFFFVSILFSFSYCIFSFWRIFQVLVLEKNKIIEIQSSVCSLAFSFFIVSPWGLDWPVYRKPQSFQSNRCIENRSLLHLDRPVYRKPQSFQCGLEWPVNRKPQSFTSGLTGV